MFLRALTNNRRLALFVALMLRSCAADDNETSLFQIEVPYTLYESGGYKHREAMFGSPNYGVTIAQKLYYSNTNMCDNSAEANGGYPAGNWVTPYLLMVDRGDCTFVNKVRNAQRLGASGVIVADNRCVCSDSECIPSDDDDGLCENNTPIMADDGSGSDISIPAILLWKSDADKIKSYFRTYSNPVVQAKLEWSIPHPDNRVEWELWTTAVDSQSISFLSAFESTVFALGNSQFFTPHFYTWNGSFYHCTDRDRPCGPLCTNGGRYCAPDPDRTDEGLSGADVVTENLRRTCIWKLYGGKDVEESSPERGVGHIWWYYLSNFSKLCDTAELFKDQSCVERALGAAGASPSLVRSCMTASGGTDKDVENYMLENELAQVYDKNIYAVPECIINGQTIWGGVSTENVLKTICHGYSAGDEPGACECQSLASNTRDPNYGACLADSPTSVNKYGSKKSTTKDEGAMPWWGVFLLVICIIVVMFIGALFYWKKTQQQMRDQVRGILAEYMPLEDVNPANNTTEKNVLHSPGLSIQA